jgi:phosphatidylglycerophosphate synthase
MTANAVTSIRIGLLPLLFWLLQTDARWFALGVLALAGFTDIIDGRIARALGQASSLGALLDLIADRLLTLTLLGGLIISGELNGVWAVAALALIARDLVVASFGEAAPTLQIKVTALERVKIALQFAAFGLLTAPSMVQQQYLVGAWAMAASAVIACATVAGYARRAVVAVRPRPGA